MIPLIDIKDPAALETGIFPSLAPNQPGLWRDGDNILVGDGKVKKHGGYTAESTVSGTIRAIEQAYAEGIRRTYFATASSVYKWEYGARSTIGSGFGGNGYWSLCPFGNHLFATNDYNVPQYWQGGSMAPLEGVRRPRFRLFKKFQNHVLGFYGQSFDFSSKSNPEVWDPLPENSAGDLFIRDLDSDVFAAHYMGQHMAVYSADSMSILQYLGAPLYFGVLPAVNGIGAVNDQSIVPVGNLHYGFCHKGIFRTDGVSFNYVDGPAVNEYIRSNMDTAQLRYSVGLHNEAKTTVEWWIPKVGGGMFGVAFNYRTSGWTKISIPVTAAAEQQVYDYPLIGVGSTFGFLDKSPNAGAGAMTSSIRSFHLDAGQRERFKRWDMLRVDVEKTGGMEVRFGFLYNNVAEPDDEPSWTDWQPLAYENWIHQESVYLIVELRSTAINVDWKLGGIAVHGQVAGYI